MGVVLRVSNNTDIRAGGRYHDTIVAMGGGILQVCFEGQAERRHRDKLIGVGAILVKAVDKNLPLVILGKVVECEQIQVASQGAKPVWTLRVHPILGTAADLIPGFVVEGYKMGPGHRTRALFMRVFGIAAADVQNIVGRSGIESVCASVIKFVPQTA